MTNTVRPYSSMESTFMALLVARLDVLEGDDARVGGDFAFSPDLDFYIRIEQVPGGSTDRFQGDFILDVEVFSADWGLAESVAFGVEALALGYPHVVEVGDRKVVIDTVSQNPGVARLPWEDDSTYRLGATYIITARRPNPS